MRHLGIPVRVPCALLLSATLGGIFTAEAAFAQTADGPSFEVASVRPSPEIKTGDRVFFGPPRGGPGTSDPGQITWKYADLARILVTAFDVQTFQMKGPDWVATQRFDIAAKVPAGATKEQVQLMWQNLLKERFGLQFHRESKEFKVDLMTVTKGGAKLKETDLPTDADFATPPASGGAPRLDRAGFPELNGKGVIIMMMMDRTGAANAKMVAKAITAKELSARLGQQLHHPVIDQTGLTGSYDFTLEYAPDMSGIPLPPLPPGAPAPPPSAPLEGGGIIPGSTLNTALEKQLGLKLTPGKSNLDVIVIDKIERMSTEN